MWRSLVMLLLSVAVFAQTRTFTPTLRQNSPNPLTIAQVDGNFSGTANVANSATRTYFAASQAAMLALSPVPQAGDWCWRSDTSFPFIFLGGDASIITNWSSTPAFPVTSVFGRSGAVTAQSGDYSVSQVTGAAASADLAAQTTTQGAWLLGWKSKLTSASGRVLGDKLAEVVSVLDFGADPTGATVCTTALQAAADAAAAAGKSLLIPNGTYKGAIALTTAHAGLRVHGESEAKAKLIAPDNSTAVVSVMPGAFNCTLDNFSVSNASGNNGTHYGIKTGSLAAGSPSGLLIEKVTVSGFDRNICHFNLNDITMRGVKANAAVYSAGVTGVGIYADGLNGGGAGLTLEGCVTNSNQYGIYLDTIDGPIISDHIGLLNINGVYAVRTLDSGMSIGPQISNSQFDSCKDYGIYLSHMQLANFSNVWVNCYTVGGTPGTALNLIKSLYSRYDIFINGNKGATAINLVGDGGSPCYSNVFTGSVFSSAGDAFTITLGNANVLNGLVLTGNTGKGYVNNDASAGDVNILNGCVVLGNSINFQSQVTDIIRGGSSNSGRSFVMPFALSGVTSGQAPRLGASGVAASFDFTAPADGVITDFSFTCNTKLTSGAINAYVQINRANSTPSMIQITPANNTSGLSGGDVCRNTAVFASGAIPVAAGQTVSVFVDASSGSPVFTSSPAAFSASVTLMTR